MANMNVNQRNQVDRVDLRVPTTGVRVRSRRPLIAFSVLGALLLGLLGYATVAGIDSVADKVVLGMIVLTTIGAMIALDPLRRG
jgi:hypothetical protein